MSPGRVGLLFLECTPRSGAAALPGGSRVWRPRSVWAPFSTLVQPPRVRLRLPGKAGPLDTGRHFVPEPLEASYLSSSSASLICGLLCRLHAGRGMRRGLEHTEDPGLVVDVGRRGEARGQGWRLPALRTGARSGVWLSRCPGRKGGHLAVGDASWEGGAHTHVLRVENPGQWAEEACSRTYGRGEPTGSRKEASGGREGGVVTAQGPEVFRKEHQNSQQFTAVRTRQVGCALHPAALGQEEVEVWPNRKRMGCNSMLLQRFRPCG